MKMIHWDWRYKIGFYFLGAVERKTDERIYGRGIERKRQATTGSPCQTPGGI